MNAQMPSLFPETLSLNAKSIRPYVKIVEQPKKSLRYRYICEGRPGTISGASSTKDSKTPFGIAVVGYSGKVVVVVSCVSKDLPYRPHPHHLVGDHCKNGLYTIETEVGERNNTITFRKLAVQCIKRNEMKEQLRIREMKKVDPFSTGFSHKDDVKSIDINVVRLAFQVFLRQDGKSIPLTPVVSEPIHNQKSLPPDPLIHRLSHCNSLVTGKNEDIILLCAKVAKEDIKIRFFETRDNQLIWEDYGTFNPNHVYNNTAICFRPPRYHHLNITNPVKVMVQLVRPSDGAESAPVPFEYLPPETEPGFLKEKRRKYNNDDLFASLVESLSNKETAQVALEASNFLTFQEIPKAEENSLLDSPCPPLMLHIPEIPNTFNNIDQCVPSTSRRISPSELPFFNIPADDIFHASDINLGSASGICQVLNMQYEQMELPPINISSGDLDMADVERLSGSFKEFLVM